MKYLICDLDVGSGDLLSDVIQAEAAVLLDRRGVLTPQIQLKGINRADAARWLREAAAQLEEPT